MNGRILRLHGQRYSTLDMVQPARDQIGRLGREAQTILTMQNQVLWNKAAGPEYLPRLVGGAIILQRLGLQTTKALVLEDDGAHLCFMTCTALALVAASLDSELRDVLQQTIKLLSMCCPVEVAIPSLPPIETLPESYRTNAVIRRQYQENEEADDGPRDVMLADAVVLLRIFQMAGRPEDFGSLAELVEITEGLRTALEKVREAASANGSNS